MLPMAIVPPVTGDIKDYQRKLRDLNKISNSGHADHAQGSLA